MCDIGANLGRPLFLVIFSLKEVCATAEQTEVGHYFHCIFLKYNHAEPEYNHTEPEYNHTNLNIITKNWNITMHNRNRIVNKQVSTKTISLISGILDN